MNCLKRIREYLKSFLKLKNEFDVSIDNNNINLYLKSEYNDLSNLKHIKFDGDNLIIDLTDLNYKIINLYVGNTLINNKNVKDLKILCGKESLFLEDYSAIKCDNLYVKTGGKVIIGAIDVKNDLNIIADEIYSQVGLFVDSNNQNYKAKKISIKHGFLEAENEIKINAKELKFFHSGVYSKKLIINSDSLELFHIRNFDVDSLIINSNKVEGHNSTIVSKSTNIISNECNDLNIISNKYNSKNKVKVKI